MRSEQRDVGHSEHPVNRLSGRKIRKFQRTESLQFFQPDPCFETVSRNASGEADWFRAARCKPLRTPSQPPFFGQFQKVRKT